MTLTAETTVTSLVFENAQPKMSLLNVVDRYFPEARAHWPDAKSGDDAVRFLNARLPAPVGLWSDGASHVRVGIDPAVADHANAWIQTLACHRPALEEVFGELGRIQWKPLDGASVPEALVTVEPQAKRWVVLIDAENILSENWPRVQDVLKGLGEIVAVEAFADFSHPMVMEWRLLAQREGIKTVHAPRLCTGKSNSDMSLAIRAMDWMNGGHVEGMVLVSGDSDFAALALRLREGGLRVHGFGNSVSRPSYMRVFHNFTLLRSDAKTKMAAPIPAIAKAKPVAHVVAKPATAPAIAPALTVSTGAAPVATSPESIEAPIETQVVNDNVDLSWDVSNVDHLRSLPWETLKDMVLPIIPMGAPMSPLHRWYADGLLKALFAKHPEHQEKWLMLSTFGSWVSYHLPNFSHKNFGVSKLSTLLKTLPSMVIKGSGTTVSVRTTAGAPLQANTEESDTDVDGSSVEATLAVSALAIEPMLVSEEPAVDVSDAPAEAGVSTSIMDVEPTAESDLSDVLQATPGNGRPSNGGWLRSGPIQRAHAVDIRSGSTPHDPSMIIPAEWIALRKTVVPRVGARGWMPVHGAYLEQIMDVFLSEHEQASNDGWVLMSLFGSWLQQALPLFRVHHFCSIKVSDLFKKANNVDFSDNLSELKVRRRAVVFHSPVNHDMIQGKWQMQEDLKALSLAA